MESGKSVELKKVSCGKWLIKKEGAGFFTCICGHCFSVLWGRWHCCRQFGVGSVGRDMSVPVEWGVSIELKYNNKMLVMGMARKKGRSRFFTCVYGCCFSVMWLGFGWHCQFGVVSVGQDISVSMEGDISIKLKKKIKR
jgi:hypothetical protein